MMHFVFKSNFFCDFRAASCQKMVDFYNHVKHCTTHPKFLHSNSTSHRWVFGAIAELIDNAIDPDVNASQFCIDMKEFNNEPCLVFMDNGSGLVPEKLHKMLSFGHSKKVDLCTLLRTYILFRFFILVVYL